MAGGAPGKAPAAYRTIGEVSRETGIAQHVLRYWETRFPELRPLVRAGRRRYYGPDDVALVRRIQALLVGEGLTLRGVGQRLGRPRAPAATTTDRDERPVLREVRAFLAEALAEDDA